MAKFLFQNGQTILFIGDSITDCGRGGQSAPLGDGYVKLAVDLITARYPNRKIRFINEGTSGNTILDLHRRWQKDAIRHRPDWLSIKIGINDLHRTLGVSEDKVPPDRFEKLYRSILETTRKKTKARLILIDPFYISQPNHADSGRGKVLKLLPSYLAVVAKMAREFKAIHVHSHAAFQNHLGYRDADHFCPEPVHPNVSGHMVLAHEFLRAVGW